MQEAETTLDLLCLEGNGASIKVQLEAGVRDADLAIAVTGYDEVNIMCCLIAKKLGAQHTVARIRNPEYFNEANLLRREIGLDMVINPEYAAALEIARILRVPSAFSVESFGRGLVDMIGFYVSESDGLAGIPLSEFNRQKPNGVLMCAAIRGGKIVVPNGDFVPQAGDQLYVVGRPSSLDQFFRLLGRYTTKVKQVFIVGGGRIAMYLARGMEKLGVRMKIVERSEERCRHINERFPKVTAICGDGTDQELLEAENLSACDAFLALTDRDEDNLILSLYAMQQGLPKVITKCNRQNYTGLAHSVGLDSVISPKFITASQILRLVRGMENSQGSVMNALYRIADGGAEAMEFTVGPSTRYLGVPLKDLQLRPGILLAVIVRGQDIIIPEGSSCLQVNDSVILISRNSGILDLNDIYLDTPLVREASGT